jgi:Na+/H+ antiporter NhaC
LWPVLLAALTLGLLLVRDRTRYCDTLVAGMSQPIVMIMILAWLLSGVLSALLSEAGFVEALVFLAQSLGLKGAGYVAGAFLACCVVSMSTGTSFGTILICGPLLYPAGGALGAEAVWLAGAILAGATFGDSLSPISDTTIASAGTQGADIGGVVKSRMKYAIPAAGLALVLYITAGTGTAASISATQGATASARGLPLVLVPIVVLSLLLAKRHLVEGLLVGILLAVVLSLAMGLVAPRELFHVDPTQFGGRGVLVSGLERGVGVSVFTLLLSGLVAALQATEALPRLVAFAGRHTTSERGAEWWIVAAVSGAVLLTTHSVVAMLAVGSFARETGERYGLSAYRRANLLDMTVCTYPFLFPYFLPTILASGTTASGLAAGMPRLTAGAIGLHNAYSWFLLLAVALAVTTGYGRREGAWNAAKD